MTLDGYAENEWVLLSYDVRVANRSVAVRVCQIVFGRVRADRLDHGKPRVQKGFIDRPGVVWIGQSVLALPPRDAAELALRLGGMGVVVTTGPIGATPSVLRRFERAARPGA